MNILVIGGSGFISSAVVRQLLEKRHRVTRVTRGMSRTDPVLETQTDHITVDRRDGQALERAVRGRTFDTVYDMVAYAPEESAEAARIFRGKTGRFIHCSTVSVYMVSHQVEPPVTEDQDRQPVMESWPRNPFGMEYGVLKRGCEAVLWRAHDERLFPVTMLRPTFVSGPADPARRDWFWIERLLDGRPLLIPGTGEWTFQQVYVEDVAGMFVRLLDSPVSVGKAYNVAGEETFSLREYLLRLGTLVGRPVDLVPIDQEEFDALPLSASPDGDVFPFNTRRNAVFSLDRIRQDLAYRSTPFDEWMRTTIDWWVSPGRGHSNGWDCRPDEVRHASRIRQNSLGHSSAS